MDLVSLELLSPLQKGQFDKKAKADDLSGEPPDQLGRRGDRSPCGQKVVDEEHLLPGLDRVLVDLKRVAAVLQLIASC